MEDKIDIELSKLEKGMISQKTFKKRIIHLFQEAIEQAVQTEKDRCKLNYHGNRNQVPMPSQLREQYGSLTCPKCTAFDEIKSNLLKAIGKAEL